MSYQALIQYLLQKLKTGDSRSINLNAIPGKLATRFDIADLLDIETLLINDFFTKLLNQSSFKFKLDLGNLDIDNEISNEKDKLFDNSIDKKISKKKRGILLKRLNTIIASEEDEFQEHGVKSFGFGYPLLVKKTPKDLGEDKIIVSPVFIWKLTIERLKSSKYTYQISRNDEMGLGLNEVLLGNLEVNDRIVIKQLGEDTIDDGVLNQKELLENLNLILSKCGSSEIHNELQDIQKIPSSKKELEEYYQEQGLDRPTIFWGGVFGLYRTLKEKIIEDTKKLPNDFDDFESDDQDFDFEHPYGCVSTDPSQQTILDNLSGREGMVIQGPPGTGKSQTITAIITNALDNNKKCLVVCEKKTALDIIKKNLSKINLGDMCAVIEDVHAARRDIVQLVRDKQEGGFLDPGFKGNEYKSILNEVNSVVEKSNSQKELLTKDYFNNTDRKSLVGMYLLKSKSFDPDLIDSLYDSISTYIEDQSYDNYNAILKIIKSGEELYFPGEEKSFLNNLKQSLFTKSGSYIGCKNQFNKSNKQLDDSKNKLDDLVKSFAKNLETYEKEYDAILNYNNNINLKYIDNYKYGEIISSLIQNHQILGDENGLEATQNTIQSYNSKEFKRSKEVYHINLNLESIKKDIDLFESKTKIQQIFNDTIDNYHTSLVTKVNEIKTKASCIKLSIDSLVSKYNDAYDLSGLSSLKHSLLSPFSQKHKEISSQQKLIRNQYEGYSKSINESGFKNLVSQIKEFSMYEDLSSIKNQIEGIEAICIECSLESVHKKTLKCVIFEKEIADDWLEINQNIQSIDELFTEYLVGNKPHKIESLSSIYDQLEIYSILLNKLKNEATNLEQFYDRICFYESLSNDQKTVIRKIINTGIKKRDVLFEVLWLKGILLNNDTNLLPKNDNDILKLYGLVKDLKEHQIKGIKSKRHKMAESSIAGLRAKGINIQSLYNKRGAPGERRNSLRRIIATDFDLFTNIFPVVLVSPQVCSSILPLEKNLFDIVLFDEASQIRLEDVMSAMHRGKQKIICGDQHQMPPTNFFAGSNILLEANDDDIEENDDEIKFTGSDLATQLANSESLLDYAEKKGYFQYMLKIHYRSEHPILIDFSNHAFYGGRLQALPNKKNYTPISFYEVEGERNKGVNEKEAIEVIQILQSILTDENIKQKYNGVIPSIGIATFNMYQRNYIWDLIQKIKYENTLPNLADKLEQVSLFVKNLDTIQGDERDIIIISTTFAKNLDGKYKQNYGPVNQSKGYRLLNVMITRAKKEVHLVTSIPSDVYTQFEERLKNSKSETKHGGSLLHAYISYCKAVHENNESLRLSILEKVRGGEGIKEQDDGLTESPFEEEVLSSLCQIIDPNRIKLQHKVGGFRIDMIIISKKTNQPLIAIECEGATYHSGDIAYCNDIFRQDILEGLGFIFHRIRSTNRRRDISSEEKKLKEFLEKIGEL